MTNAPTGEVEIRHLFPVPIMVTTVNDAAALNAALMEVIKTNRAQSEGIARSNILGWHSDTEMLQWGGGPARTLGLAMLQTVGQRTDDVGMKGGQPRYEMHMEMWANVSPANASNQMHCHPGCIWSGVYYVDDGGDPSSSLVLMDPNYPTNRMYAPDLLFVGPENQHYHTVHEIEPAPGRMVIFPSWLNHSVKPHNGPRDRISIAMNVMAIPGRQPPQG